MDRKIDKDRIEILYENRFLKCYDLQYAAGKHYYEASRRERDDLVVRKPDQEFREMLPDAVTIAVILHLPGNETRLGGNRPDRKGQRPGLCSESMRFLYTGDDG